jgi:perosamine synthetase
MTPRAIMTEFTDCKNNTINADKLTHLSYLRGRVALYAILKALGIEKGDEIAIQGFTCMAVPEAVISAGALPVYVDIEKQGVNMDPDSLSRRITNKTRAVIVQHTYGIPARIDSLMEIASKYGAYFIEDCCHTYLSTYHGRRVGSFGVASFYSFEWGKPVVAGVGGSALSNDMELLGRLCDDYKNFKDVRFSTELKNVFQLLVYKQLYNPYRYWILKRLFHSLSVIGLVKGSYNQTFRTEINEDFLLKMSKITMRMLNHSFQQQLTEHSTHSSRLQDEYSLRFGSPVVNKVCIPKDTKTVYARFPLIVSDKQKVIQRAQELGVEISDWYNSVVHPLDGDSLKQVYYREGSCPRAESISKAIITLPINRHVDDNFVEKVIKCLK